MTWNNQRGVALMLVLSSIMIISTVVVEFAYDAHVSYAVASTQRDRLKATYLAHSALNLIRLQLSKERELRQRFAGLLSQMSDGGIGSQPFCKMFPLSTGMLQGLASGLLTGAGEEGEGEGEKEEETPEKEGEDLFDLGGDFEGLCDVEEGKVNLNAFRPPPVPEGGAQQVQQASEGQSPPAYETQKDLLVSLINQPELEKTFDGSVDKIRQLVTSIADWADSDDRINEAPGLAGGYEDSLYGDLPYKPKNGKYASTSELLLIPGLGDDIYRVLEPNVTVFGDDRINLCQSEEGMIKAFLVSYSQTTPGAAPFNPNDEPRVQSILESIQNACSQPVPDPVQVAQAITSILGGPTGQPVKVTKQGVQPGTGLAARILTQNRFYSVTATGQVGEVEVRIKTVLDTESTNPNLWKTLYYRVE